MVLLCILLKSQKIAHGWATGILMNRALNGIGEIFGGMIVYVD